MKKFYTTLMLVGLLASLPSWADEPMFCDAGDYAQYSQLAKQALTVKESLKKGEEAAIEEILPYDIQEGLIAGQTWGDEDSPYYGRTRKLHDCYPVCGRGYA